MSKILTGPAAIIKSASEHGLGAPLESTILQTSNLADRKWRMNNMYRMLNEQRESVPFKMRDLQENFYDNMWWRNILLKSRQVGGTTLIELLGLDSCIFIPNFKMMVIAHRKESAASILEEKCLYPYLNMHPEMRERVALVEQNKTAMTFSNGSSIEVTTSGRSGTGNFLHISEFGHIAAKRPDIAREIISGTLPGFHQGAMVFIESTAEGSDGQFFEMCQIAQNMKRQGKRLTEMDFKFHFYGFQDRKANRLTEEEAKHVDIPPRLEARFDELRHKEGIALDLQQKAWYTVQERTLQQDMKKEQPATPKEAFEASGEGLILDNQMQQAREDGRITEVPHTSRLVYTFWDIGVSDETSVIFMQQIGDSWKCIHYLEASDDGMEEWVKRVRTLAQEKGWMLGNWVGPHDLKKRGHFSGTKLWDEIAAMGVKFEVVPKVDAKMASITKLRSNFSLLSIDEEACEILIKHLDNYRWEYDDIRAVYKGKPLHNKASNAADALQQWAMWIDQRRDEDYKLSLARPDKKAVQGEARATGRSGMSGYL